MKSRSVSTAAAAFMISLGCTVAASHAIPALQASQAGNGIAASSAIRGGLGQGPVVSTTSCTGSSAGGAITMLARLAPGHSISELQAGGVKTFPALDGDAALVVVPGLSSADASAIAAYPGVASYGELTAHTSEAAWKSCDYKLMDNPSAAAFGRVATQGLIAHGIISATDASAPSTTLMISDDPTDSSRLFVSVIVSHSVANPTRGLALSSLLTPYVATIDKTSGLAMAFGEAHWYDGETS
jgi:hypothetical protein